MTVQEYLITIKNTLIRKQALSNASKHNSLGKETVNLAEAIFAFPWHKTPEKSTYWRKIYNEAEINGKI